MRRLARWTWSWWAPASPGSTCSSACGRWASRPSCSRAPTTSAAPGTGTATRVPAATSRPSTTRTASIPSSRASGRGRRSTPPSPRSCATCSTSPTSTTCAATSEFSTRVDHGHAGTRPRRAGTCAPSRGDDIACRCYVMATGCLSLPKAPDIEGADRFQGDVYFTSRWPHEGVDFTGKRVAVIGTGSSGIQSIPIIAEQAAELAVFQRTPNFSRPAQNGPVPPGEAGRLRRGSAPPTARRPAGRGRRAAADPRARARFDVSEEERLAPFEAAWESGDLLAPDVRRLAHERGGQRDRRRVPARQDPLDRARPRDGRGAVPEGPLLRHQAPVPRHRTTTRPSTCPTSAWSTCARTPITTHHRDRHRHRRPSRSSSTPSCSPPGSTP